jgi:hypothetical protein
MADDTTALPCPARARGAADVCDREFTGTGLGAVESSSLVLALVLVLVQGVLCGVVMSNDVFWHEVAAG